MVFRRKKKRKAKRTPKKQVVYKDGAFKIVVERANSGYYVNLYILGSEAKWAYVSSKKDVQKVVSKYKQQIKRWKKKLKG